MPVAINIGLVESQIIGSLLSNVVYQLKEKLQYENQQQIIARIMAKKRFGYIPRSLKWDGITYLIDKNLKFPTGLLRMVTGILDKNNVEYSITNNTKETPGKPIRLKSEVSLWPHQRDAIEAIKINKQGIIRAGCGAGKTILSTVACAEIGQFPFLFLVNRISLLKQTYNVFSHFFDEKIGIIGNGEATFGVINVATVQTICSILNIKAPESDEDVEKLTYTPEQIMMVKSLLKNCKFLIADEVHNAASETYLEVIKNIPSAIYRGGLTATPWRNDGKTILLNASFGEEIYCKTSSSLIREGILVKPKITIFDYEDELSKMFPAEPKKGSKKALYKTVYKKCVVDNKKFNNAVAKIALVNAGLNRPTLISVKQINHGNNILKEIKSINSEINVVFLNGQNKNKLGFDKIKEDFTAKKIPILISTIFDEGVDIPAIDACIDAGGGVSSSKALQLVGRAMRKYPGKKFAYIYLFIQNYTYLKNHAFERIAALADEEEFELKSLKYDG